MKVEIIDQIVNETNRYYEYCHRNKNLKRKWVLLTLRNFGLFWDNYCYGGGTAFIV